ncbi:MmcQ/YjbR family DNA-binding protein [Chitinophaga sp. GCM10012297]|uniref:MmcQ/YjbR family DNA-binding protein n=1 Tax=Chitinophaga chungangae TaxID=2821488 RepID=A0ABS3YFS4_9BACT|nr:MmcQ/YjbR family DNA-binding protein [Chitinophaga chungangae]MBO9153532.1 MmcQ/YjbR family DNA-binding protein [Chitinophaga chungangae]
MISIETFREICLSMPETYEVRHWENAAFRTKKRIFATVREAEQTVNFRFTPEVQAAFCAQDAKGFYPVKGGWGLQGWTIADLRKVKRSMLVSAVQSAWYGAAPPKLQEQYRMQNGL